MKIKTTVIGAYPKIGDDLASQELRRALHRYDRREIDDAELDKIYDDVTARAIAEIQELGVDVINDAHIRWDDPLAPFARAWSGVERGPLERFYDNNTYFRQPVISGQISSDGKTLLRDVGVARNALKLRRFDEFKAAVVGPLTFATLAQDEHYRSLEERVLAVADAVAREIEGLKAAGVNLIDVEDPAIVAQPKHIELAREAYVRLGRAGVNLCLATYFFPADPVLEALASFPVYAVAIDVRSRETTAFDRLDAFRNQIVVLGAVDARNTRLETAEEVAGYAERALRLVPEDRLWLSPTTSLEYLPRDIAKAKVGALVEGARKAAGEKVPV